MIIYLKKKTLVFFLLFSCWFSDGLTQDHLVTAYKNQVSNQGVYGLKEVQLNVDPKTTILVIIDFWDNVAPQPFIENTINLIELARSLEIPVIFFSHEKSINSQLQPSDKDIVLDGYSIVLENYIYNNKIDVKTILYAGYHSSECLTITRINSISRIAWRSSNYEIIVIKDCTFSGYWHHLWAMNSIETRFHSTTVLDLTEAFNGTPVTGRTAQKPFNFIDLYDPDFKNAYMEEYNRRYKTLNDLVRRDSGKKEKKTIGRQRIEALLQYDTAFGLNQDWKKHALVVMNPSTDFSDDDWSDRARINIENSVLPMIEFARQKDIEVVFFTNNHAPDSTVKKNESEQEFDHPDSLFYYLGTKGISTLIYIGNLTNSSTYFTPLDAWRFTIFNEGFEAVFVEDCIITDEIPESVEYEIFKKVFLERAIFYRDKYRLTTLSILASNAANLHINEIFSDEASPDNLTIELYNNGPLTLDLSRFNIVFDENSTEKVSLPSKVLEPGAYYLVQFSDQQLFSNEDTYFQSLSELPNNTGLLFLGNIYNDYLTDSISYSTQGISLGKFPDGGSQVLSYDNPSLGRSNYFVEQEKVLCDDNQHVKLKVPSDAGVVYEWYVDHSIIPNSNVSELLISDSGQYTVILRYENQQATSSLYVIKHPLPSAAWQMDGDLNFCEANKPVLWINNETDNEYYWLNQDEVVGTERYYSVQSGGSYSLLVKSEHGCFNQSEAVELRLLASGSQCLSEQVIISPNPSKGEFTISVKQDIDVNKIELYNAQGIYVCPIENFVKRKYPNSSSTYEILVNVDVADGLYFIVLNRQVSSYSQRVVIIK